MNTAASPKKTDESVDPIDAILLALSPKSESAAEIIARTLSLPMLDDIPRPGQAKNWTFDDWIEWGKPLGFVELPRTTHAYVMAHPKYKKLLVSLSSTSSDRRSAMASACEARLAFRDEYLVLSGLAFFYGTSIRKSHSDVTSFINDVANFVEANRDTELGRPFVRQYYGAYNRADFLSSAAFIQGGGRTAKLKKLMTNATSLLGCDSPRLAVREALTRYATASLKAKIVGPNDVPTSDEESRDNVIESVYSRISKGYQMSDLMTADLIDAFETIIEVENDSEEQRKLEKQRDNQAKKEAKKEERERQKVEAKAAATVVADTPEAFAKAMSDVREKFATMTQPVVLQMGELAARIQEIVAFSTKFPSPAYPAARMKQLSGTIEDLTDKLEAAEDTTEALTESNTALKIELERVRAEYSVAEKMLDEAGEASDWRSAYEKLVADLDPALSNSDFLALADGVRTARALLSAARERIAAAAKRGQGS